MWFAHSAVSALLDVMLMGLSLGGEGGGLVAGLSSLEALGNSFPLLIVAIVTQNCGESEVLDNDRMTA